LRVNLLEAYFLAINNFRPEQNVDLALWHTSPLAEKIRSERLASQSSG
jgi:hypothetical protein